MGARKRMTPRIKSVFDGMVGIHPTYLPKMLQPKGPSACLGASHIPKLSKVRPLLLSRSHHVLGEPMSKRRGYHSNAIDKIVLRETAEGADLGQDFLYHSAVQDYTDTGQITSC